MYRCACIALLLVLAGATITTSSKVSTLELLRLLTDRSWLPDQRPIWQKYPRLEEGFEAKARASEEENSRKYSDENVMRLESGKRSALATALTAGRRRRQPAPALGKAVTPYIGVGVLNDMESFFDSLRDNLETVALLSPHERSTLFQDTPTVVQAPVSSGISSGGGTGIRKLHALRPLRPAGNIRSYNRRSLIEPDGGYPGANHHDPGLLWTGLGRR